ncbi:LAFE_0C01508g1_1 [Lachancea fermentati]|uniref:pyridoxal kinase n=1 Tax=Lachancea fermentati TaxID=4955 RepID=A0A1G4M9D2_LACFM|nr:LAFE_0C01508g1_1 [Lachancea fermentati]
MAKKVLSIQSHVVHGYVGNKAATFPLQYRGWDVDALNTVQFSNHPAYGHFRGFRSTAEELREIIEEGLVKGLGIKYDAVLTGYLPDVAGLRTIAATVTKMCKNDPSTKWILDPVLGDNGRLYVPEETIPIYKGILEQGEVFLATPNQFEMEILTCITIKDYDSLKRSINKFHELFPRVKYVVVTSVSIPELHDHSFLSACSDNKAKSAHYFQVEKIDAHFSGSGDLFSALLVDTLLNDENVTIDLPLALNKVLSLVDSILQNTFNIVSNETSKRPLKINDLKLIESRNLLRGEIKPRYKPIEL